MDVNTYLAPEPSTCSGLLESLVVVLSCKYASESGKQRISISEVGLVLF